MAQVMLREKQSLDHILPHTRGAQALGDQIFQEQLFPKPDRHRHAERLESTRCKREIGFDQSFELEQRFIVEGNVIDVVERLPGYTEAIIDGVFRKAGIMLLAS